MKEVLFLIGACFAIGGAIGGIIKTLSRMVDPNEHLSDKMPPYYVFAIISLLAGVCLGVSYFCF